MDVPGGQKFSMARCAKDLNWRFLSLILVPLSLLVFLALAIASATPYAPITSALSPLRLRNLFNHDGAAARSFSELNRSRIAVCLVGGARRFELTGPSIVKNILEIYPNADLFLHSPYDKNSFKFLLLKAVPRIAWVRIFEPKPIPESESQVRVLTASNSPNGIQGLLQYFNLVEGCLTMIKTYQTQNNFSYDWVIRTRVDSYWSTPLDPTNFISDKYIIPAGSSFGSLNDRLGIGDLNTSVTALSRLSLVPQLDALGFRQLNSETSFRAQLTTRNVTYKERRFPFCIVSDRRYNFPLGRTGVPVAAISSSGPLSGAKCRPCVAFCTGRCVGNAMRWLDRGWSWTDWENGSMELCDARGGWEKGWERVFDRVVGKRLAGLRELVSRLKMRECVEELEEMRRRSSNWEAPAAEEMCKVGLSE